MEGVPVPVSVRIKDLRAAIAWLSTYRVGQALPEDPPLTPKDYRRQAAEHRLAGYPESESIALAMMYLAKEIERRERANERDRRKRLTHRVRYRGEG